MPAKKKPAPKAPAKPVKKAPAKPAPKKAAKPAPNSKPAAKTPAKVVKKVAKPASPKKSPIVKNAPAKSASKPAAPAKKPAPKAAPAAAPKKAAVKTAPAAKKESPKAAVKEATKPAVKAAAPAKKAAPAAAAPTPAPAPVAATPAPAPAKKAKPEPKAKPQLQPSPAPAGKMPLMKMVRRGRIEDEGITIETPKKPVMPAAVLKRQRQRLVELRDAYLNSAEGVANESLRGGNDGGDSSAFGMHQADAGSDAYDRDFALSLLAKEQDAIYEINEALKRIDVGTYGLCEMSGELIPEERLEALPFTRFTVACQERIEREQMGGRWNRPVRSLFGLDEAAEDSDDEREEEETSPSNSESLDFSKE